MYSPLRSFLWFLVGFGLAVVAGLASAQAVVPDTYWGANVAGVRQWDMDPKALCTRVALAGNPPGQFDPALAGNPTPGFNYACIGRIIPVNPLQSTVNYGTATSGTCPVDKPYFSFERQGCAATKPTGPQPPKCDVPAGTKITFDLFRGTGGLNSDTSDPGTEPPYPRSAPPCGLKDLPDVKRCYSQVKNGKKNYYCTYEGISDGTTVPVGSSEAAPPEGPNDPREDVPPIDAPDPSAGCPKGTVNVGLNSDGVPRCVGTGTDPKNTPPAPPKSETETTQTSSDGTKTTTKTEITTNSDGSKTIVKTITVVKADGTKETTQDKTVTPNTAGNAGKDDSKLDDEKYDLCKQNPNLTICKNSSVAGTCGQVSCIGDAIQCATLRATSAMQCKQQQDEDVIKASAQYSLGSSVLAGNDPAKSLLPSVGNATVVDLNVGGTGGLSADGWLGAGAAFDDVSFTVMGQTIVIPFAKWSAYLVGLRYALMVAASLVSFRILSGAILKE